jgi:formylmethanofuran dehydrogenase subunit A
MATYYFNNKGEPATPFTVSGEELVSKGLGIKAIAPEGIEAWRLSYNLSTKVVDVLYEGLSEEDAAAKRIADDITEAAANLQAEKDKRAANEAE